ncbi:MAG: protein kinase [Bacteroidales bacterium]|nr:protein kinase [Bacteroidales bacterium]
MKVTSAQIINSGAEADIKIAEIDDKKYALKVFHKGFHSNKKIYPTLKRLGGKGVIADIYERGVRKDGLEVELMEYIPGGSLARYDLKGNAAAITTIVLRTAMALETCHKYGIIHKDIKPANILVKDTSVWDCVLCDFGIADMVNSEGKVITKQSRTPIYAAPEIYDPSCAKAKIDGNDLFEITPAADFYSLGMTALCLWSGEEAFKAEEEQMAIQKIDRGIPLPNNMPERLRNIVAGLLKKNPSERWRLKDIEKSLGGHWAVMHTLHPLSDVKLDSDPKGKDYAMTGKAIGEFLNKVYMWQFGDAKAPADAKICQAIVDSFSDYAGSYMQLFFESKGDYLKKQESWMRYCCDWSSKDNAGKAGPQDEDTRLEISMMKTIKGFGFTPYYEFENDTVTALDELRKTELRNQRYGLSHGLKGWLAVQFHENPDTDLSVKYKYERLLEEYLLEIEKIYPKADECAYFRNACGKEKELEQKILDTMRKNRRHIRIQTVLDILLVVIPMLVIVILAFGFLHHKTRFFYFVTLAAAICLLVLTLVKVLFHKYKHAVNDRIVKNMVKGKAPEIGYEERVIEPLYYAFSIGREFDSSLNGIINNQIFIGWGYYIKERRKKLIKHIAAALLVVALACMALPKPKYLFKSDTKIETPNEQVQ